MRLTNVFNKRGWLPEHKVEFQQILPLSLRDKVSGKNQRGEENECVQEIMDLLACLKKNEYSESPCSKEFDTLKKCHKTFLDTKRTEKEHRKLGILTPGAKNLTHHQANTLLKKFPQK